VPVTGPPKDVAACPKMSLKEYVQACMAVGVGNVPGFPWAQADEPLSAKDVVGILCALGALEPLGASAPRACDIVSVFNRSILLPPATVDSAGKVQPSQARLFYVCAPRHRSLVVDELRVRADDLTAAECGTAFFKALQVMGFSESFCPPGEPGDGTDKGVFSTVEHVVLCPGAGFDVHARNFSTVSPARFSVFYRGWGTC
jgi:hypothetical protein